MIVDRDVQIPMADGIALAADVFRPAAGPPAPVIMSMGPYSEGLRFQRRTPPWRRSRGRPKTRRTGWSGCGRVHGSPICTPAWRVSPSSAIRAASARAYPANSAVLPSSRPAGNTLPRGRSR
jgi:hypothetical protein